MIYLIIKSYLSILLSVSLAAIILFVIGLYLIFKKSPIKYTRQAHPNDDKKAHDTVSHNQSSVIITAQDIKAIAGGDVIATQLDLARAYTETGRKKLAKKILQYVVKEGNSAQQTEAMHLLTGMDH